MKERKYERRHAQLPFYEAIADRRRGFERRGMPVPAIPGAIRPAPGVTVFKERRRFPESGME